MSVDERTRIDGQVDPVDPRTLLRRGAARGVRAASGTCSRPRWRVYAPRPLMIDVDGDAWTLAVDDGVVRVVAGARRRRRRPCCARTAAQLEDLVTDQVTVVGMQTNGIARPARRALRRAARLVAPAARRARCAARRTRRARSTSSTPTGAPLALDRSFPADAPLDEMGDFLQRAGLPPHRRCVRPRTRWPRCRATWTPPRPRTRSATAGRGGRATAPATTCSCACSTSTRCRPRSSGSSATTACSGSPTSPATATCTAAWRTTASRRCSSRSTWSRASPTCRGTRTARSVVTATTAAA